MIITCEECFTRFNLDEKLLKPSGSKVRCSKCEHVFVAHPQEAATVEAAPTTSAAPEAGSVSDRYASTEGGDTRSGEALSADEMALQELDHADEDQLVSELGATEPPVDELDIAAIEQMFDDQDSLLADVQTQATPADLDSQSVPSDETDLEATDFELDDLDQLLNLDEEPAVENQSDLEDLDFDIQEDEIPDPAATGDTPIADSDLDLDDLENLLELDEESAEGVSSEKSEADSATAAPDVVEEVQVSPAEDDGVDDIDDELDLSELEDMLDFDTEAAQEATDLVENQLEDVELELDERLETPQEDDTAEELDLGADEELDLSDIEEMLGNTQEAEQEESASADAEEPEVLDIDYQLDTEELGKTDAQDSQEEDDEIEELDLADLDLSAAPTESEAPETEDFELEFDTLDTEQTDEPAGDSTTGDEDLELAQEELGVEDAAGHISEEKEASPAEEKALEQEAEEEVHATAAEVPVKKKRATSPVLVLVLLLVLAGGGLYGAHYFGVQIPFVSPLIEKHLMPQPQVQDPVGSLKIRTTDINSRFVNNTKNGKLFVISGNVVNDYPHKRGNIRVVGKLFTQGKVFFKQQNSFCGNVLSDIDLANLDVATVQQRLQNRTDAQTPPGQKLPFMIVFGGLPENLEEFTVEVLGSVKTSG